MDYIYSIFHLFFLLPYSLSLFHLGLTHHELTAVECKVAWLGMGFKSAAWTGYCPAHPGSGLHHYLIQSGPTGQVALSCFGMLCFASLAFIISLMLFSALQALVLVALLFCTCPSPLTLLVPFILKC